MEENTEKTLSDGKRPDGSPAERRETSSKLNSLDQRTSAQTPEGGGSPDSSGKDNAAVIYTAAFSAGNGDKAIASDSSDAEAGRLPAEKSSPASFESSPQAPSEDRPKEDPEAFSKIPPEELPKDASKDFSKIRSEELPKDASKDFSKIRSEELLKDASKELSKAHSEGLPKGASKDLAKVSADHLSKEPARKASKDSSEAASKTPQEIRIEKGKAETGPGTGGKSRATTYKEKILRHKKRRYRRTILLVAFLTVLLVTAVVLWMRRGYTHAELSRIVALAAEDGAAYENLGGNVVQYSNDGAICIDQRGNTLWNVSYEMQQPITSVSGNVIAIANRSGYYVYVMNTQGLMGTIHTTLPIHNIAAADNGEVAVIMNDTKSTWIRLYTAGGREIAYIVRTMAENGYPIAAAVSPDGETLCLSSVQMSNAAVKTNISFFNFGKAGQKVSDHLVEHSDFIDEVIPYMHYFDNSTCVCVSDKQLFCFWTTLLRRSGSTYVTLPENMQGVFCGDSFVGILSNNIKGETQYTLDLYNKRGKKVGQVHFTMQYTDISIAGDKVYINNEQQCQVFTIGGRCLFDGTFGRNIRALIPGADLSDLLVVTGGEVDSVRLH